ncbi:uncharacterized protein [Paramisgurnus dabryanus]|uniref:uncharacterized protein isoform X1 n=1 Tax=Paramisgurnus dabryanus TaxID=90735 RepID=UPI0031F38E81
MTGCCVYGCTNRYSTKGLRFHRIPTGSHPFQKNRRRLWLQALKRVDNDDVKKNARVCSAHFISGEISMDSSSPDFVPSVFSYSKKSKNLQAKLDRYHRKKRRDGRHLTLANLCVPSKTSIQEWSMVRCPDASMSVSDAVDKSANNTIPLRLHWDAATQWEDPSLYDHNYTLKPQLNLIPPTSVMETQCVEPAPLYVTLLRNNQLCQLYTGLILDVFYSVADHLTNTYTNSFQLHPWDQLLMTLMKLRLNLLQGDLAERFGVSQSIVSKVISCWIDIMEENMRYYMPWLPRETIQATMPQYFKEQFPNTTCVIDCSETPLQKPFNLDARDESYIHYYGQSTIKYLVCVAPCGLIMFISPAYEGKCSDAFITANSGLLEYLGPGDEVIADRGFTITDLLDEKKVKLVVPAFTKKDMQLSEEDNTNNRHIMDALVHVKRVICQLKNFKVLSQTVSINLIPKINQILRICAALCNLQNDIISDVEDE